MKKRKSKSLKGFKRHNRKSVAHPQDEPLRSPHQERADALKKMVKHDMMRSLEGGEDRSESVYFNPLLLEGAVKLTKTTDGLPTSGGRKTTQPMRRSRSFANVPLEGDLAADWESQSSAPHETAEPRQDKDKKDKAKRGKNHDTYSSGKKGKSKKDSLTRKKETK